MGQRANIGGLREPWYVVEKDSAKGDVFVVSWAGPSDGDGGLAGRGHHAAPRGGAGAALQSSLASAPLRIGLRCWDGLV